MLKVKFIDRTILGTSPLLPVAWFCCKPFLWGSTSQSVVESRHEQLLTPRFLLTVESYQASHPISKQVCELSSFYQYPHNSWNIDLFICIHITELTINGISRQQSTFILAPFLDWPRLKTNFGCISRQHVVITKWITETNPNIKHTQN